MERNARALIAALFLLASVGCIHRQPKAHFIELRPLDQHCYSDEDQVFVENTGRYWCVPKCDSSELWDYQKWRCVAKI